MSGHVFHAPSISAHPAFELSAVVERRTDKACVRYPDIRTLRTVDEMIQDPNLDLIVVNTPNETHLPFARAALLAGKHVVVEKPFTVTTAEADELIALARKCNRILTVYQNRRFDGGFLTVQKILQAGLLGPLAEVELHYDRFRNYVEPNTWKEEASPGVGILYNLGSHMLDQVLKLFGKPAWVDAVTGSRRPGARVMDYYDIRLDYGHMNVIVKSSYLVREPGPQYVLHGVMGSYVKFGIDPQEQALKDGWLPGGPGWGVEPEEFWGLLHTDIDGKVFRDKYETVPGNYQLFYDNLADAIQLGKPLLVDPRESREVIRLIECVLESDKTKRAIEFSTYGIPLI